ncbi:MAG: paraquat-inducible protein A [Rhodospirillaceae bacterium]|nr:paraquat-inducible protein A [Rhodospirillaceae bacterium]
MSAHESTFLTACLDCGALYQRCKVAPGEKARCCRCGRVLYRGARLTRDHLLALVAAALIVLVIANTTPIVYLQTQGVSNSATLLGSILVLWREGQEGVAALAFVTTLAFPALELCALAGVLLILRFRPASRSVALLLRGIQVVRPWGMVEVFLVGVLVALVKLSHMADVRPGVALWGFACLAVLLTAIVTFDLRELWDDVPVRDVSPSENGSRLVPCHVCGLVCGDVVRCSRCGARLHVRKPDSLSRTWALLIAAAILYVPANMLPIMRTTSPMGVEADTIMSGIVYFWTSGSPDLAVLIFVVSIFIPLAKLASMAMLALTVQRGSSHGKRRRTVLYRLVEFVGRWSMVDVFVVALMVGLVRLGSLVVIDAASGATAFGAVVVLTILAAHGFDPRLLWDAEDKHD